METYPERVIVKEMLFHEKGTVENFDDNELENQQEIGYGLEKGDKNQTIYVYYRSGDRSKSEEEKKCCK